MYSTQDIEEERSTHRPLVLTGRPEWTLVSMVGRSVAIQRLFSQMRCTARHLRVATIEGENGTGKALAAQTLHDLGPASAAPFIPCAAVEFFHEASPATPLVPAMRDARDGTLFLSHVEELSPEQQARLLGLLQWLDHQHTRRVAHSAPRQVFFSSNLPLRRLATFRMDLCHRLTAIRFVVPPLRDRHEDLPLLADYFAQRFSAIHGKPVRGLGPQALPRLILHSWPGNVRELESVIHSAALDCEGQWIRPIDLPSLVPPHPHSAGDTSAEDNGHEELDQDDPNLDRAILRHIRRVLTRVDGNKLRAARMLGISRSTLYRLLDSEETSTTSVNT